MLGFEYLTPTTDASGNTDYTGTTYYYEKNIFGDVVAIYDENGTKVGGYGFNSYGQNNVVTNLTDDSIASLNPIRYRSYYYDTDIYLYYLQSRYYDPVTCRFINLDYSINANGDVLGFNIFAYCSNNPIMFADPSGEFFVSALIASAIVGGVVSLTCSVISTYIEKNGNFSEKDILKIGVSTVLGAATGALCVAFPAASVAISSISSAAESVICDAIDGENIKTILINGTISAGLGAITGSWGSDFVNNSVYSNALDSMTNLVKSGINNTTKLLNKATRKAAAHTIKKAAKSAGRYTVKAIKHFSKSTITSLGEGISVMGISELSENYFYSLFEI